MVSSVNQMEAVQKRAVSASQRLAQSRQQPSPSRVTPGYWAKPRWFSYFEDAWSRAKGHSSFALFGSAAMRLTKIDPNPRLLAPKSNASSLSPRFLAFNMNALTLSPKFQVVVPKEIREAMKLKAGMPMQVVQYGERIEFIPVRPMRQARGMLRGMATDVERDDDRE